VRGPPKSSSLCEMALKSLSRRFAAGYTLTESRGSTPAARCPPGRSGAGGSLYGGLSHAAPPASGGRVQRWRRLAAVGLEMAIGTRDGARCCKARRDGSWSGSPLAITTLPALLVGARVRPAHAGPHGTVDTWLILPVVICLSQRLSHACLSISTYTVKLRMAH
jgi:hypothetical protein